MTTAADHYVIRLANTTVADLNSFLKERNEEPALEIRLSPNGYGRVCYNQGTEVVNHLNRALATYHQTNPHNDRFILRPFYSYSPLQRRRFLDLTVTIPSLMQGRTPDEIATRIIPGPSSESPLLVDNINLCEFLQKQTRDTRDQQPQCDANGQEDSETTEDTPTEAISSARDQIADAHIPGPSLPTGNQ